MNIFGIGIDVVEVTRIESSIEAFGERFIRRIFTDAERDYCQKQKFPAIHFAARFAAKEAVAKALGTGVGKDLAWLDMEVSRRSSGEPLILLSGDGEKFAEKSDITHIKISLTHTSQYAAANAIALCSS